MVKQNLHLLLMGILFGTASIEEHEDNLQGVKIVSTLHSNSTSLHLPTKHKNINLKDIFTVMLNASFSTTASIWKETKDSRQMNE